VRRLARHAIHALTCEACKDEPLCSDVVAPLRRVIANDPNAKVRFEALRALLWRDPEIGAAAIDEFVAAGDRELLTAAAHARRRSVPAALRHRAKQALALDEDRVRSP